MGMTCCVCAWICNDDDDPSSGKVASRPDDAMVDPNGRWLDVAWTMDWAREIPRRNVLCLWPVSSL